MPNINDYFPSKYLKASDLKGREPVVTIKEVVYEPVGQAKQMKAVVLFKETQKGMVLNKTNANRITQIAGSGVTEEWRGVQIKLYSTQVEFQGEPTDAIRVKPVNASRQNALRPADALPSFSAPAPAAAPTGDIFSDGTTPDPDRQPLTDDDIPF